MTNLNTITNVAYELASASSKAASAEQMVLQHTKAKAQHSGKSAEFDEMLQEVLDNALAKYAEAREHQLALMDLIASLR